MTTEHSHGNRLSRRLNPNPPPVVRKVPASSVPHGESISRNGKYVWVGLDGERVICVEPSAQEARRKVREIQHALASKAAGGG
jgi:hypothetical protein